MSKTGAHPQVNNHFYDTLGNKWYDDDRHIIALLRAEAGAKLEYIRTVLKRERFGSSRVLDIGCGAGLLTNPLAKDGHFLTGVDLATSALAIAKERAPKNSKVEYLGGDAHELPFADSQFEVVLLMDILEHVEHPEAVIAEAARVLRRGGLMFFHTFNRTQLARLVAIKAVEAWAHDCPEHFHVFEYFIRPEELKAMCEKNGFTILDQVGVRPRFGNPAFWQAVLTRRIDSDKLDFKRSASHAIGYMGIAMKTD